MYLRLTGGFMQLWVYSCWFCPDLFLGRSWMNLHTLQWTYLSRVFLTPFWETLTMKCIRWDKSHHLQSGLYYNLKIPCWPIQGVTVLKTACLIDFCLSHRKEEKTRLISKLLGTHSTERYFLEKQISFQKLIEVLTDNGGGGGGGERLCKELRRCIVDFLV